MSMLLSDHRALYVTGFGLGCESEVGFSEGITFEG